MIYFTELDHLPIYDVKGYYLGRVVDVGIEPSQDPLRVAMYFVKTWKRQMLCIAHDQMQSVSVRAAQTRVVSDEIRCESRDAGLIRMRKDVLDQQIIDSNHQKVVRVNDVEFDIQPDERHADLRIVAVDPSWAAAVRRLLQGVLAKYQIRLIAGMFPAKSIPWDFVNLIEPDPARRVKLRLTYERLSKIHPADLAGIIQELSRDEQRSLIESLDEDTAAHAVSEIPTRLQADLLESIPTEKAADIVEAMPPDDAAHALQELPPEASAALLASMENKEAQEIRGLLGFETETAGGMMTTDCIAVASDTTVADAIAAVRWADVPIESVHAVHMTDPDGSLKGVVPLIRLVVSDATIPLRDVASDPLVSAPVHASTADVVGLFRKYGLLSLPVVDDKGRLAGVVTVDDVLDRVAKARR